MKKMPYIIISIAGVLIAAVVFAGCAKSPAEKHDSIMGISLRQSHMDFGACYSFYLREDGDLVLFDADVRFEDEPFEIVLESCQVDAQSLGELKKLEKELNIGKYVSSYKKLPSLFNADDKTVNTTTLYFKDGTEKSAESGEYAEELYNFFLSLSIKYQNMSVSNNDH